MADLAELMELANSQVKHVHLELLVKSGVASSAIIFSGKHPEIGIMDGQIKHGVFTPGDGSSHVVQPVLDVDGKIIDIVAWRRLRPDQWGLMHCNSWVLGESYLDSWHGDAPVMVATPLEWLRHDSDAFCILDWAAPELRQLKNLASIRATEPALGRALISALQSLETYPHIMTVEAQHDAAA